MQKTGPYHPIGIFDSGFGGLTILREIERILPDYDYLYLGDNARAPYGNRSFETIHTYTLQAVMWLFNRGCHLVILACNTASAKALRSIQQKDLPLIAPERRVLGVIRPVTEQAGRMSSTGHIGIFGTSGTINSNSYVLELNKFFPELRITQEACPMWVPLVENGEAHGDGTDYFIRKHTKALCSVDSEIDTVVLGCTHYPLLEEKIRTALPDHIRIISQGAIVAECLEDYLTRHPEIARNCSQSGKRSFFTTEKAAMFERAASRFYQTPVQCEETTL